MKAVREVSEKGKYNVCLTDICLTDDLTEDLTEELASLKTENKDTLRDVTEELASLKTEKKTKCKVLLTLSQEKVTCYQKVIYKIVSQKKGKMKSLSASQIRENHAHPLIL